MATLFLICGLPGAGKTTLSKELEADIPALRLCPDEWILDIFGPEIDRATFDAVRDSIENVLWKLAARVLTLGQDVILEYGFWALEEREDYRARAEALGATVILRYVTASPDELWRRIEKRNEQLPPGYRNTRVEIDEWLKVFQPPTAEEFR